MGRAVERRIFLKFFAMVFGGGYASFSHWPITVEASDGQQTQTSLSADEIEVLTAYSHSLLPILEPAHPRYRQVAKKLAELASQNDGMAGFIRGGINAVEIPDQEVWHNLSTEQRAKLVAKQEATPFFGFLHWTTSEIVMREEALWQRLGYQGSAIEQGGYIHRGFDDIDWLPQPGKGLKL